MSRTKKFVYNTIASAFQQLANIVAWFLVPHVILQHYGSAVNGITASITQFISLFTLVEAGIGASAIFALYKPLADENHGEISAIAAAARKFYFLSGYIFVALTILCACIFPFFHHGTALSAIDTGLLVLVLGVSGVLDFFTLSKYYVILTADQKSYVIAIGNIVSAFVSTAIIVVMARFGCHIVLVRFAALFSVFLRSLILFSYMHRHYAFLDFSIKPNREALGRRWDALYLQILGMVQVGAPVILITIFLDYKAVSVYSIYYMAVGGVNALLSIFMSGLSASFGDILARGETSTLRTAYRQFEFTYYAVITFVYSCTIILILPFVRLYTRGIGDVNYNLPVIGFLIVLNGFLYNLKTPQGMLVISAGLYRETKWQTLAQGAIAVAGGAALIPFFGMAGVLLGSILSNLYRDIDLLFFIPRTVTGLPVKATLLNWRNSLLESIAVCMPLFFLRFRADSFGSLALWGSGIAVYAGFVILLFSLFFNRPELQKSTKRILYMAGVKFER